MRFFLLNALSKMYKICIVSFLFLTVFMMTMYYTLRTLKTPKWNYLIGKDKIASQQNTELWLKSKVAYFSETAE